MRVLVTGCAGFIGTHLCASLAEQGHHVIGVDSLTDYYDPSIKRRNLDFLSQGTCFSFREQDASSLREDQLHDVGVVFHLAAQPGVRLSWGKEFEVYVQRNITTTERLLSLATKLPRLTRFVYASSSSVYGEIDRETVGEDDPLRPYSPYGVTKLAGEGLCHAYSRNFGVPAVALRFFTVYGPRQRPDMAFTKLIRAALTSECFGVYGDGTQERDFTYVGDIVQALCMAAFCQSASGVFNVGGGRVASLMEAIDIVNRYTGGGLRLKFLEAAPGDVRRTSADTSRIRGRLGYKPATSIEEGLRSQINWMKDALSIGALAEASGGCVPQ